MASLLILAFSAASSPLQQSFPDQDQPISRQESMQPLDPLSLLEQRSYDAENVPASLGRLEERDTYNCTDLRAAFDFRCWNELGLSGYLMDPNMGWNHTVRICNEVQSAEDNDGSNCCKVGEPWTTCFLRLAHGTPGQDCSQINSQFCSYQSGLDPYMDDSIKPQVQYVMKNIYGESTGLCPQSKERC